MNVPVIKSSIAAVVSGSVSKFYFKDSNKESVASGLTTGVAVAVTDTLFKLSTMLPSWFAALGYYGQDVASSLLDAGIRWIATNKAKMEWAVTHGGFVKDFLVSLGSSIIASYVDAPVRGLLPANLAVLA
jgi:hypothetical protein